jgi:hypothetical protein
MTNSQVDGASLVVVDGSNIATEGRSVPSLAQLNDAVLALTSEFPDITVTVVVDATFGHRIDKSEVSEFDEAVAHNELVTPPAGAIGRGDAFVLSIANKVGARIFSNDSFQEFHGVYPWLFDEGRLIGGKPVPHVGWVFVNRVPVKGPVSRKARGSNRDGAGSRRTVSKLASLPMPIPTSPPPGRVATHVAAAAMSAPSSSRGRRRRDDEAIAAEAVPATGKDATQPTAVAVPATGGPVNDLLPFLDFVQHHPLGSAVTGTVESYSSHGAYVKIGDVRGYVPLRLMGSPPPRSAREVMRLGDTVSLAVASYAPPRRSIDLAVPGAVEVAPPAADEPASKRRGRKAVAAPEAVPTTEPEISPAEPADPRRRRRSRATEAPDHGDVAQDAAAAVVEEAPTSRRGRKAAAGAPSADAPTDGSPTPKRSKRASSAAPEPTEPTPAPAAKKSAAKKAAAAKSAAKKPAAQSGSSGSGSAKPATQARRGRAANAAPAPAPAADSSEAPKRRTAKKAAAPKAEAATVDSAGATTEPAPRRRRSKPSAGD